MSTTRNLLLGVSLLSTFACVARFDPAATPPSETSSKYEIADISPSLSAQSDGAQITVYAALFKGGAFLELSPGDTLTGTVGSETHPLAEVKEGESIHYTATFAQPATPAQATVSFARADGRRGGDSTVLVPAPFTVATAPPATVSHQGSVSLTLTGIGVDELDTEVRGVCVKDGQSELYSPVQAGGARLDFSTIPLADSNAPECDLELSLIARTLGTVDPHFAQTLDTTFEGDQRRVVKTHMTK